MSESKGAFFDAVEAMIDKDMKIKKDYLKKMIDEPEKYQLPDGMTMEEFIFGDIANFADNLRRALEDIK